MKLTDLRWLLAVAALTLNACADEGTTPDNGAELPGDDVGDAPPLQGADTLLEGAPSNDSLPDEPKADQVFPAQFDVVEFQSPIKSQGSRGVCSIFSTVALMESLYIKEGTLAQPDFSEQYLQWSVKFEVGAFRNTGGSNATSNLDAISRYGIVDEATWPYQTSPWSASNDSRCTGEEDARPTLCHTNGEPSDEIKGARKYKLPSNRWVSSRRQNIKAFIFGNKQAVIAGMTFFYQSWNHGASSLPVNGEYSAQGYVLYPNEADKTKSLEKRAGHSILLVGWDDNLEVPVVDEKGNQVLDAAGKPVVEKGFFLFKNSWGTSRFGTKNPFGAGYGWLSMKYVEEYASVAGADLPRDVRVNEVCDNGKDDDRNGATDCDDAACADLEACKVIEAEICNDGIDNDDNGATDCADAACTETAHCAEQPEPNLDPVETVSSPYEAIPDADEAGIIDRVQIDQEFTVGRVELLLDIVHTYRGDLRVKLVHPDGTSATIWNNEGGGEADLQDSFIVDTFAGKPGKGVWTLEVADTQGSDLGTLREWALFIAPLAR